MVGQNVLPLSPIAVERLLTGVSFRFLSLTQAAHENPTPPCVLVLFFQSYTNSNEEDVAPESGAVISAEDSPSGKALLVAAYEESNTLAVFEINTED